MSEAVPSDPLIGKTLGPCRVDAVLGRGGMGVVYKAHHLVLDRPVAVKVLSEDFLARHSGAADLLKEARAAARLEDPRIVQVHDLGQDQGYQFIIMQLAVGENLQQRVAREGRVAPRAALAIVKEVARALGAAHRMGIVHRDIKPSNILVDASGIIKLMDFGIAAAAGTALGGPVFGSPQFMAPEQAAGEVPDPRCDFYALGVTYFYLLAGKPPYESLNLNELMLAHREAAIPDVRQANPEVTATTAALIQRLMAKSPGDRPASAEELLAALDAPGMLINVDTTGSPFRLLPPPLPPEPEAPAAPLTDFGSGTSSPTARSAAPTLVDWPAPLPEEARRGIRPTAASRVLFVGLYVLLFAGSWSGAAGADWMGGLLFSGAALAALYAAGRRDGLGRALGALFLAGGWACFWAFAKADFGNLGTLPLELQILLAAGFLLGGSSYYLGLASAEGGAGLSASLLAFSILAFLAAALLLREGPSAGWAQAGPSLRTAFSELASSGGGWRWLSLSAFYALSWIFFP